MKYFVTGATGFIGGRLVRRLVEEGHEVVALVRDPAKCADLARHGIALARGDITQPDTIRGAMAGADGVFHLAALYELGIRDRDQAWRVNVEGTRHVLEAMRDLGIPKGVYTSSVAIFGDTKGRKPDETYVSKGPWPSVYDVTKWEAHHWVAQPMIRQGLPLVILQPGVVYGPGDRSPPGRMLARYMARRLPAVPKDSAWCWAHVDDVVQAHIEAMQRGAAGETYIVCGPAHTLVEALQIAERVTGVPAPRLRIPPWILKVVAAITRSEEIRAAAGVTYLADDSKARRELGFAPRPLEAGLRQTLAPRADETLNP